MEMERQKPEGITARLDVEAVKRDKQRRIPRVEVPPAKKEENKEGTDEEHTHMEGEVTNLRTRWPDRHNGDGGSK